MSFVKTQEREMAEGKGSGMNNQSSDDEDDIQSNDVWIPPDEIKSILNDIWPPTDGSVNLGITEEKDVWNPPNALVNSETESEIDLLKRSKKYGITETAKYIRQRLNRHKREIVKFAVSGRSGIGKSSFINMMRGVKSTDEGFAKVGRGNKTKDMFEYPHPKNTNISFCDLPGFGTTKMTKADFLRKFDLAMFDYFFIFIELVISEDDVWLVENIKKLGIPFCFIRAKIDLDVAEGENLITIKEELSRNIEENVVLSGSELFLISNKLPYFHFGDLCELCRHITSILPEAKVEALMFFFPILTPDTIKKKKEMLEKRIKGVSALAGGFAAIPIPLVDIPIYKYVVKKEIEEYIRVFKLDGTYVKNIKGLKHAPSTNLNWWDYIKVAVKSALQVGKIFSVFLSQVDTAIPILGSAFSVIGITHLVLIELTQTLIEVEEDALKVYEHFVHNKTPM